MSADYPSQLTADVESGSLVPITSEARLGGLRRMWKRFARQKLALAAAVFFVLIAAFTFGAPLISKFVTHMSYQQQDISARLARPGTTVRLPGHPGMTHTYWLGSDELGRDVLTRLAYGGRISLLVALASVLIALLIGVGVGLIAGHFGGAVDTALMRIVDVVLSIPNLFLLLLISTLVNNSPTISRSTFYRQDGWLILPIAIGLIAWTTVARLVRAEVLVIRELDYVFAARVAGVPVRRILLRHVLPNAMPVVIVWATLTVPLLILLEAAISYLGLGEQIPTPSWGNMLSNSTEFLYLDPFLVIVPGVMIVLTGVSINLIGNGLQAALDPRA